MDVLIVGSRDDTTAKLRHEAEAEDLLAATSAFHRWRRGTLKAAFRKQLTDVLACVDRDEVQKKQLQKELDFLRSRDQEARQSLVQQHGEAVSLQLELESWKQMHSELTAAIAHARSEARDMNALRETEAALRKSAEEEKERAMVQLAGLQQQYNGSLQEVQSLLDRLAAQDHKVATITSTVRSNREAASSALQELAQVKNALQAAVERAATAEGQALAHSEMASALRTELSGLQERYQQDVGAATALKEAQASETQKDQLIRELQQEVEKLALQARAASETAAAMEAEAGQWKQQLDALQQQAVQAQAGTNHRCSTDVAWAARAVQRLASLGASSSAGALGAMQELVGTATGIRTHGVLSALVSLQQDSCGNKPSKRGSRSTTASTSSKLWPAVVGLGAHLSALLANMSQAAAQLSQLPGNSAPPASLLTTLQQDICLSEAHLSESITQLLAASSAGNIAVRDISRAQVAVKQLQVCLLDALTCVNSGDSTSVQELQQHLASVAASCRDRTMPAAEAVLSGLDAAGRASEEASTQACMELAACMYGLHQQLQLLMQQDQVRSRPANGTDGHSQTSTHTTNASTSSDPLRLTSHEAQTSIVQTHVQAQQIMPLPSRCDASSSTDVETDGTQTPVRASLPEFHSSHTSTSSPSENATAGASSMHVEHHSLQQQALRMPTSQHSMQQQTSGIPQHSMQPQTSGGSSRALASQTTFNCPSLDTADAGPAQVPDGLEQEQDAVLVMQQAQHEAISLRRQLHDAEAVVLDLRSQVKRLQNSRQRTHQLADKQLQEAEERHSSGKHRTLHRWQMARDQYINNVSRNADWVLLFEAFQAWKNSWRLKKVEDAKHHLDQATQNGSGLPEVLERRLEASKAYFQHQLVLWKRHFLQTLLLRWFLQSQRQVRARCRWVELLAKVRHKVRLGLEEFWGDGAALVDLSRAELREQRSLLNRHRQRCLVGMAVVQAVNGTQMGRLVLAAWHALSWVSKAAACIGVKEQQLDALTAGLPAWVQHVGSRRLLERGWTAWRLAFAAGRLRHCRQGARASVHSLPTHSIRHVSPDCRSRSASPTAQAAHSHREPWRPCSAYAPLPEVPEVVMTSSISSPRFIVSEAVSRSLSAPPQRPGGTHSPEPQAAIPGQVSVRGPNSPRHQARFVDIPTRPQSAPSQPAEDASSHQLASGRPAQCGRQILFVTPGAPQGQEQGRGSFEELSFPKPPPEYTAIKIQATHAPPPRPDLETPVPRQHIPIPTVPPAGTAPAQTHQPPSPQPARQPVPRPAPPPRPAPTHMPPKAPYFHTPRAAAPSRKPQQGSAAHPPVAAKMHAPGRKAGPQPPQPHSFRSRRSINPSTPQSRAVAVSLRAHMQSFSKMMAASLASSTSAVPPPSMPTTESIPPHPTAQISLPTSTTPLPVRSSIIAMHAHTVAPARAHLHYEPRNAASLPGTDASTTKALEKHGQRHPQNQQQQQQQQQWQQQGAAKPSGATAAAGLQHLREKAVQRLHLGSRVDIVPAAEGAASTAVPRTSTSTSTSTDSAATAAAAAAAAGQQRVDSRRATSRGAAADEQAGAHGVPSGAGAGAGARGAQKKHAVAFGTTVKPEADKSPEEVFMVPAGTGQPRAPWNEGLQQEARMHTAGLGKALQTMATALAGASSMVERSPSPPGRRPASAQGNPDVGKASSGVPAGTQQNVDKGQAHLETGGIHLQSKDGVFTHVYDTGVQDTARAMASRLADALPPPPPPPPPDLPYPNPLSPRSSPRRCHFSSNPPQCPPCPSSRQPQPQPLPQAPPPLSNTSALPHTTSSSRNPQAATPLDLSNASHLTTDSSPTEPGPLMPSSDIRQTPPPPLPTLPHLIHHLSHTLASTIHDMQPLAMPGNQRQPSPVNLMLRSTQALPARAAPPAEVASTRSEGQDSAGAVSRSSNGSTTVGSGSNAAGLPAVTVSAGHMASGVPAGWQSAVRPAFPPPIGVPVKVTIATTLPPQPIRRHK